jgi:hypothetical protein
MNWWLKSAWLGALLFYGSVLIWILPAQFGRVVMAVCVFAVFARRAWIFTR